MATRRTARKDSKPRPTRRPRRRETKLAFEALAIEGILLSPHWLTRVAALDAGGQSEADYCVPKGLQLRDEISRYWRIAQAHWSDFAAGRASAATPEVAQALSERFVLALLRESFGFASLTASPPLVIAERSYPLRFAALDGRVPVVIAPAGIGLDTPAPAFGDGGRRRSAFGLTQEYLNAAEGATWGLATDGLTLRILRDNASLTRPAWIEADLARIFIENLFPDFMALWLLAHETRFGRADQPPTECALETWRDAGREEGTRAREHLRIGVEEALLVLGQGFLAQPENSALRAALQNGALSTAAYFQELLRLVYRLIFLLTVEERGLLHPESSEAAARGLYIEGYSLRRLREQSIRRSAHDRFFDLWEATKIVFRGLAAGEPRLALPALAGIFAPAQCPTLDAARLENRALLLAVFRLSWVREASGLTRGNWRDMGPEELGSVYESLLELVPQVTQGGRLFAFAAGDETRSNARKTSGSYYTPDSLVQVLLDSALEPVVASTLAASPERPVEALLELCIVDPACGSGHFLLAVARRLAGHIARFQANGTPSAAEYRHALRQVVGRCLYGVDLNPMAVELCKVSLWMEAVEPGLPLTFLNSHIQHGNALLGTTPELMAKGVPDAAWDPIEGDDRKIANALKKRNKKAAGGQRSLATLWSTPEDAEAQFVRRAAAELEAASDTNSEALARKESRWDGILGSTEYRHQKFIADAWCAAFVWPKQPGELAEAAPTNDLWRQIRDGQGQPPAHTLKTVGDLASRHHFFHWHLQFPQVFAMGGFHLVLGNPPWVRQELLKFEKPLLTQYLAYASTADSSVYFLEKGVAICRASGRIAMLTPNKWFRAGYAEALRRLLRERCRIELLIDFGHSRTLFPDADTFPALVTLRSVPVPPSDSDMATFVRAHDSDLGRQSLGERMSTASVLVPHGSLRSEQWHLDDLAVNALLQRLLGTGSPLASVLERPLLSGIKTGLNEAFYVDTPTRDSLVNVDPGCTLLFKKMLRGRDIKRWKPYWSQKWHIVIPSSQNRTWPWSAIASEDLAEEIFARSYPAVHSHLKKFEAKARARQDRGTFWWELRSCDYYDVLEAPKLVVQCIAYYSQFALDEGSHLVNNKVLIIPSADRYLLSVLNSRVTWWIINRTFQHMKDEGLSVDIQFLKKLPIPNTTPDRRREISAVTSQLVSATEAAEVSALELRLDALIEQVFALTAHEHRTLVDNLPPRDPISVLKGDPQAAPPLSGSDLPPIPNVVPLLPPDQEAAILIWALLHAHGGTIPRTDLARAFALRTRPDLLTQLAPAGLAQLVQSWASKVGQRAVAPGLLAAALRALSDRSGVELTADASLQSVVKLSPSTPSDDQIDPWFRFEARLALYVLRSQAGRALRLIDAVVTGEDRILHEQVS
jgi:hypothetical protein